MINTKSETEELLDPTDLIKAQTLYIHELSNILKTDWDGSFAWPDKSFIFCTSGLISLQTLLVVFQVVSLIESLNHSQNYQKNSFFSGRLKNKIFCRYIWLLEKRSSFNRFIITTITITTHLSIFSQVTDTDKLLANLMVELVPLLTSTSLAMSLILTSSWLIWLCLFLASR